MTPPIDNRFQNQRWPVRLWRRRYLLLVPWHAVGYWRGMLGKKMLPGDPLSLDYRFRNAWGIAMGMAHVKMKWHYTMKETMAFLEKRRSQKK